MGSGEETGAVLSDSQQAVLTAVCDTVVPSLPRDRDPEGLWARKASDIGVDAGVALLISEIPDPSCRAACSSCSTRSAARGSPRAPSQVSREQILRNIGARRTREAAAGVAALIGDDALPQLRRARSADRPEPELEDASATRARSSPPPQTRRRRSSRSCPRATSATLEADVCIVGSGAGRRRDRRHARASAA